MTLLEWERNVARVAGMDEAQWRACRAPLVLLACLRDKVTRTKDGRRRLRLWACACARRHWDRIDKPPRVAEVMRAGVEMAERFADGEVDRATFEVAVKEARRQGEGISVLAAPAFIAGHATLTVPFEGAWEIARLGPEAGGAYHGPAFLAEQLEQCRLLRDVFANPFRPVKRPTRDVLRGSVSALAETIYRERTFAELPVLADALEDAGCDEAELLRHLRSDGPHVRGCWALDLVRG
jgi:hypothetical protein